MNLILALAMMANVQADEPHPLRGFKIVCPNRTLVPAGTPCPKIEPKPKSPDLSRPAKPKYNRGRWVTTNDYPKDALQNNIEGTNQVLLDVGKDGKVVKCHILRSSGAALLDQTTCNKITQRARFYPATNHTGEAVAGSFITSVRWKVPGNYALSNDGFPKPPQSEYFLSFISDKNSYPAAAWRERRGGDVVIELAIDDTGKITRCSLYKKSKHKDLDMASCPYAEKKWVFSPALDVNGKRTSGKVIRRLTWWIPIPRDENSIAVVAAEPKLIANPFLNPGTIDMNFDVAADGFVDRCSIKSAQKGDLFEILRGFEEVACNVAGTEKKHKFEPFKNEDGSPVAKRVKLKLELTHEDAETSPEASATK